ncbi:S1C family serine protease [Natronomonas marina]|jgi:serine protease Do|uniref:S1C family serine protease n=1 Tax=Natronomonas marina TaxID=2961939 RepID=UPI0020CA0EB4|nr:trypsin-like peptidase domain-containing protein [Natronomonas marina]
MVQPTRRRFLAAAAGVAAGLAGCSAGRRESPDPIQRETPGGDRGSVYTEVYRNRIDSVTFVRGEQGSGSGFVYDGYVVTNQHVAGEADAMDVRFEDGDWREAGVVATDVYADLAVLSTDVPDYAAPLRFVETIPPVGTEVVALGSPFGLESSVSTGIISGKDRALPSPSGFSIPNTVQTDAGLDPGNSGGPLLTLDGAVTGIAVAGAGTSVGFAVSPLLARRVLPELVETGEYEHPFLGIALRPVTPAVAEANDLDAVRGVIVVEVLDSGPEGQTLQGSDGETTVDGRSVPVGGDVIVELAGNRIESDTDLGTTLALELSPGDRVPATVIRDGERREIEVPIGARPEPGE